MKIVGAIIAKRRAFSLVEMMVAVALFVIVLTGIYAVGMTSEAFWQTSKTRVQLQQQARKAMAWMIRDFRQASNSSILDVPADGTWYNKIRFKIPSDINPGGSVVWGDDIVFEPGTAGTGELHRVQSGITKTIARDIQSARFRRFNADPDVLEVFLSAQDTTPRGETLDYPLNFAVQLRN